MSTLHKNAARQPVFRASDGCLLAEILHPKNDDISPGLSLARATLPPGKATKPHMLEFVEIYYVLSGEGLMYVGDEKLEVGPESCIYVPARTKQRLKNTSKDKEIIFLCVCQPAYDPKLDRLLELDSVNQ